MRNTIIAACLLLVSLRCSQTVFAGFIDTELIGNPGNAHFYVPVQVGGDDRWYKSGYFGGVSEAFRIGTTEVTNDQYVTFLNAVAASDPRRLFDTQMQFQPRGGIIRTGTNGNYSYSSKPLMGNKPVLYISLWSSMRLANWLHNGRPSGTEDNTTTEDGAYFLDGQTVPADRDIPRKPNAKWFIPNEDEWFKAAYHKNDGATGNYWEYPTATDDVPIHATADASGNVSNPGSNVVNYFRMADWNGLDGNVTTVGSAGSPSAYGTFDQGGNVDEFTETLIGCDPNGCPVGPGGVLLPIVRGGTWRDNNDFHIIGVQNGNRDVGGGNGVNVIGIRLASLAVTGDFDLDFDVDGDDLDIWSAAFGVSADGDADGDGDSDGFDFLAWQRNFDGNGSPLASPLASVPEPSGVLLGSLGVVFAGLYVRRPKQ